ncbi:MAG: translocation/assembly module TamB domain-containing protein [Thermodesulfovibrionales bacterium]
MQGKKVIFIVVFGILLTISLIVPRLPFIKDNLKAELIKELTKSTGMNFTVDNVSLNLIPLFVSADGIKGDMTDVSLNVIRIKAYLDITNILQREIGVNKLVIKGAVLDAERVGIETVSNNIKEYLKDDREKPLKVSVRSVDIEAGAVTLRDGQNTLSIDAINMIIKPQRDIRANVFLEGVNINAPSVQDLRFNIKSQITYKDDVIDIGRLFLSIDESDKGSSVYVKGDVDTKATSSAVEVYARLLWDDIKRVFRLKNKGDGWLETKGNLRLSSGDDLAERLTLDLDVKGEFFIETLMELLKVREPLSGYVTLQDAKIKGRLDDLEGKGNARLKDGNIFDVKIDTLLTDIEYSSGAMRFTNGKASLYNGYADVFVMIALPVVNYFEVDVKVKDISSTGLFRLIKWDPKISEGKVTGHLTSKGRIFNPAGRFTYINNKMGKDILGRIKRIESDYKIFNNILSLPDLIIESPKTVISAQGVVDIGKETIDIKGKGNSADVLDLASPYFKALSGKADFTFHVGGGVKDPVIDLNINNHTGKISTGELGLNDVLFNKDIAISSSTADLTYKRDRLFIKKLTLNSDYGTFSTAGNVYFKESKMLFDLRNPHYDLVLNVNRVSVDSISGLFKKSPKMTGIADSRFSLSGKPEDIAIRGNLYISDYGYETFKIASPISSDFSYKNRLFRFSNISTNRTIRGNGSISLDKAFTLSLSIDDHNLDELFGRQLHPYLKGIGIKNLRLSADGSIENPVVEVTSQINISTKNSRYTVRGDLSGTLRNGVLDVKSRFLDSKVILNLHADVRENIQWRLKADLKTARYDFLISHFLKDVPDDLVLTLNGNLECWGDKERMSANARFDRLYFNIYGNGFSNKGDISLKMTNNRLFVERFMLFNDTSEFSISGNADINKSIDITLEGNGSLAPLKALSTNIDALRGDADFVVSISGDWKEPKINGGIDIRDGSFGLKDFYYRLTSVNGYVYFDEDKIIISNTRGKLANGDVTLSGNATIKGFKIGKFFIETKVLNAHISPSRDLWVNFDGNLILKGDISSQQLLGEVKVRRGRYAERVDWKTWLISARKIEKRRIDSKRFDNMAVNVKVSGNNFLIENNLANSTIDFDVLLRGKVNSIIPIGKVETKEGTVFFRNNEFRIIKANVDFANMEEIKPYFNIVADTKVQNYNIRLTLEGFTEQFNLSLTSDPYLAESDILALLTVGQTGKHLKGLEAGIGASEATAFLTGKLQDVFEERAKTITGFDRIQIDPSISRTTSTISPRVTVSKKLMGDRLYVTYSASVTTGEEQVWKLEYMLDKNLSIIGIRDERGGLGADVKYRFQFK